MQQEEQPGQARVQGQGPDQPQAQVPPTGGRRYRSLFWAIVLIGAGVLALLFNLDVIGASSLGMLTYVWPILLIGVGVDLLLGRRSAVAGAVIGIVTVGLIVVLMVVGPSLGWTGDTEIQSEELTVPVAETTSARVSLDTGGYSADIRALPVSSSPDRLLLDASVAYRGTLQFESSGDVQRTVNLSTKGQRWWWPLLDLSDVHTWDIGLDGTLPLDLTVSSSAGSLGLDLSGLQLAGFKADMSSGDVYVFLPALKPEAFDAAFEMSSGDLEVETAAGAQIDMSLDMSSGDASVSLGAGSDVTLTFDVSSGKLVLTVASEQALRIEVRDVSSGNIDLPAGLVQTEKGEGREGTWETQGYSGAAHRVLFLIESMSSGNVRVERAG